MMVNWQFNNKEYSDLSPQELQLMYLSQYFLAGENTAWYHVPIMAESPIARSLKYKKYTGSNYKNIIARELLKVFTYEAKRIKLVQARKAAGVPQIDNFDRRGDKFVFLPFLNQYLNEDGTFQKSAEQVQEIILNELQRKADKEFITMRELGLFESQNNKLLLLDGLRINHSNLKESIDNYVFNSFLATTNIIQLTSTDLAYFKDNVTAFQKRNKQINAPGTHLNTNAYFIDKNGVRHNLGKKTEKFVVLEDNRVSGSESLIQAVTDIANSNPLLTPIEREIFINSYKNREIDETDAQGYRTLDSAREIIAMSQG